MEKASMPFVYGEEVEYGLVLLNSREKFPRLARSLFAPLLHASPEKGIFTANGSRFYVDREHPEMATPECVQPADLVLWSMANDLYLLELKGKAQDLWTREGREGSIQIFKNNSDGDISFGCHENYMISIEIPMERLIYFLMPFLVTRQLFCGTGSVWRDDSGRVHFEISQRSRFMSQVKSATPTFNRGIISTRQEHETLAGQNFRRLHLILADSNMSEVSQYVRVAATGLVLEMIERNCFDEAPPLLRDTIQSLHRTSEAENPHVALGLADGRIQSALEIQWWYANRAEAFLEENFKTMNHFSAMKTAWETWVNILTDLQKGFMNSLAGSVDWVIKKQFLDYILSRHGCRWDNMDEEVYQEVKDWDLRYHSIETKGEWEGLFNFLKRKGKIKTILDPELVVWAKDHPPQNTRAFTRGTLIREFPVLSRFFSWDKLELDAEHVFEFPDPLNTYVDLKEEISFVQKGF
jgi:proteasome accessory factor A